MSNTVTGTVKLIDQTQTFASGFQKREFVITTAEQYPQDVKFEVVKDKCDLLDRYKVGQSVTVSFNIRGNEYNGKYYVSLQAWKIEAETQAAPAPVAAPVSDDSDLPF
jgi:hypothetical protein